jgi:hypothetical protein
MITRSHLSEYPRGGAEGAHEPQYRQQQVPVSAERRPNPHRPYRHDGGTDVEYKNDKYPRIPELGEVPDADYSNEDREADECLARLSHFSLDRVSFLGIEALGEPPHGLKEISEPSEPRLARHGHTVASTAERGEQL